MRHSSQLLWLSLGALVACNHDADFRAIERARTKPDAARPAADAADVDDSTADADTQPTDETDAGSGNDAVTDPEAGACNLEITSPKSGQEFRGSDDTNLGQSKLQIQLNLNVDASCGAKALSFGVCTLDDMQRPVGPTKWQGSMDATSGKQTVEVTLADTLGDQVPCVQLHELKAVKVLRGCETESYHVEAGQCVFRPGCSALKQACGSSDDCCARDYIAPDPGTDALTFQRGYDKGTSAVCLYERVEADPNKRVALTPFYMDRYEVTVARFRKFVEEYDVFKSMQPKPEAGRHPKVPVSAWQTSWTTATANDAKVGPNTPLVPPTAADLKARVKACGSASTFTDAPGVNDARPINCVSFFEAFLFCVWDGDARLPSEAEWNAAAAAGSEQRAYPWSDPPSSLTITEADYAYYGHGENDLPLPAGSRPKGHGKWGTLDLAGNVYEWVRDTAPNPPANAAYDPYSAFSPDPFQLNNDADKAMFHVVRGGSFKNISSAECPQEERLRTSARAVLPPTVRINDVGFRCVRNF